MLAWLLGKGIHPDVRFGNGNTLLINAASNNDVKTVRLLLSHGANVNGRNEHGETAFSFCCANNCMDAAKALAEAGAEINSVDEGGGSPLDWAACHASKEFRAWLVSIGARRIDDSYEPWPPPEERDTEVGQASGKTQQ